MCHDSQRGLLIAHVVLRGGTGHRDARELFCLQLHRKRYGLRSGSLFRGNGEFACCRNVARLGHFVRICARIALGRGRGSLAIDGELCIFGSDAENNRRLRRCHYIFPGQRGIIVAFHESGAQVGGRNRFNKRPRNRVSSTRIRSGRFRIEAIAYRVTRYRTVVPCRNTRTIICRFRNFTHVKAAREIAANIRCARLPHNATRTRCAGDGTRVIAVRKRACPITETKNAARITARNGCLVCAAAKTNGVRRCTANNTGNTSFAAG